MPAANPSREPDQPSTSTASRAPKPFNTDREIWRQQDHETPKQYQRFIHFCELGRLRSLTEINKTLTGFGDKIEYGTLRTLSSLYRWPERALAWDQHQDDLDIERIIQARREKDERHIRVASALIGKALTALREINIEDIDASNIAKWIKLATDLENQVLGEPQRTISVTGPAGGPIAVDDLSTIPPEVRKARLRELAIELAQRVGISTTDTEGT